MRELLLTVFENLAQAQIEYCLLRDYDQLDRLDHTGEIDLLVRANQLEALNNLLPQLGFVKLPGWGHAPHHFFVAYDQQSDSWLKLDVVTEVVYGRPIPTLRTPLAASCLGNRQRRGPTFVPAPEDELVTLLLHCALDKGDFAPARIERLQALRHQVTDKPYLSALLVSYWLPIMTWRRLAELIDAQNWAALLADRKAVVARLAGRDKSGTQSRQIRNRILRKLNTWLNARRPRSLTVALLAPDGAGKSTLAASLQQSFYFPVRSIYMGLYQKTVREQGSKGAGEQGRNTPKLPTSQTPPPPRPLAALPGLSFASRLVKLWWRYLTARYHQARGRLVIFDRYTYDSRLPASRPLSRLGRWRRWLLAHACPPPDLVLLLDAPGEVLYSRKGEHTPLLLEAQRQAYLKLKPHLPQLIILDATADAEYVRREAISLIWQGYLARQTGPKVWAGVRGGKGVVDAGRGGAEVQGGRGAEVNG